MITNRYGQTGTGKTYTMEGELTNEEKRGLVPRAAQELFQRLSVKKETEASVTCSYLEIYNEDLTDLLAESGAKLSIFWLFMLQYRIKLY